MKDINVLIIDDDPMVSHINHKYTENIPGFKVINEVNVESKMEIRDKDLKNANLLLLDIYLPGKDGINLLKEFRSINERLDVIIISASKNTEHISKAMKWGVVDYLIKPFSLERFKKSLQYYQKRKNSLENNAGLEQKEIDSLMGKREVKSDPNLNFIDKETSYVRQLPKGLSTASLKKIIKYMKEKDEYKFTTIELAEDLGFSRVTVQRYLKYLSEIGRTTIIREYGTVGRPRHFYKLVELDN